MRLSCTRTAGPTSESRFSKLGSKKGDPVVKSHDFQSHLKRHFRVAFFRWPSSCTCAVRPSILPRRGLSRYPVVLLTNTTFMPDGRRLGERRGERQGETRSERRSERRPEMRTGTHTGGRLGMRQPQAGVWPPAGSWSGHTLTGEEPQRRLDPFGKGSVAGRKHERKRSLHSF